MHVLQPRGVDPSHINHINRNRLETTYPWRISGLPSFKLFPNQNASTTASSTVCKRKHPRVHLVVRPTRQPTNLHPNAPAETAVQSTARSTNVDMWFVVHPGKQRPCVLSTSRASSTVYKQKCHRIPVVFCSTRQPMSLYLTHQQTQQ